MPVVLLRRGEPLPDPRDADPSGLVAVGGDLTPMRLIEAYRAGIFPWYEDGMPVLWHCPDPRFVLPIDGVVVGRSLRKTIRKRPFVLAMDQRFAPVVRACATQRRPGQRGTWITRDMHEAYVRLHELGYAHSIEAYCDGHLVGGLYGVAIGGLFCGESMFAKVDDASKIAFVYAMAQLAAWGFSLVDCQVQTAHLERFGAQEWPRTRFLREVAGLADIPTPLGKWRFDDDIEARVEALLGRAVVAQPLV